MYSPLSSANSLHLIYEGRTSLKNSLVIRTVGACRPMKIAFDEYALKVAFQDATCEWWNNIIELK